MLLVAAIQYGAAKWLAALITIVLLVLVGGVLTPRYARWRAKRLKRARPSETAAERDRREGKQRLYEQVGAQPGLSALLGADGRMSTSKTVAALWTAIVAWVLIALILAWPGSWDDALKNLSPTYLLLLGGPYATLVFAKAVVASKLSSGTLQKPPADGYVRLSDLVNDDRGRGDIVDIQFLLFNIVAVGFVISAVVRAKLGDPGFPEIPTGLITLTGGPAAVYAVNKGLAGNQAVVMSVMPELVREGDVITVFGANFLPAGGGAADSTGAGPGSTGATAPAGQAGAAPLPAAGADTTPQTTGTTVVTNPLGSTAPTTPSGPVVEVGGLKLETIDADDNTIHAAAKAPPGNRSRPLPVSVITQAGQRATLADALTVLTAPELLGLDRAAAKVGDRVTLTGNWTSAASLTIVVLVGGLTAVIDGQPLPGSSLTFVVPPVAAPPGAVKVKLVVGGLASNEADLQITG